MDGWLREDVGGFGIAVGGVGISFSMRLLCSDALVDYSPPSSPMGDRK